MNDGASHRRQRWSSGFSLRSLTVVVDGNPTGTTALGLGAIARFTLHERRLKPELQLCCPQAASRSGSFSGSFSDTTAGPSSTTGVPGRAWLAGLPSGARIGKALIGAFT